MMMNSDKMKKKPPKDSLTLLPCFYFVEIMLVEGLIYCLQSRLKLRRPEGSINAGGCNFNSFLRRTVRFVGVHVFGLCATALVTDIIQLSTGYHTPFFLTVCKPNYTLAGVSCDRNAYITKDICSGHDQHAIMAASTKLLKPVLVFAFAIAAALTGLTQITQHRSHPIDVYVGFLIGAFIAAYLAFHAVANFKSSDDVTPAPPPPPLKEDPLRALTERGHESVYNKGPASASESNDEIAAAPAPMDRLEGLGPLQREKDSMGSLKRASVDVELLAPRSPMGKETMLTFSNTLPRASMNVNGVTRGSGAVSAAAAVQPVQRRLKAVQVPMDPMRSQQLVSEWKQKSMEMRGLNVRDEAEHEASEDGSEVGSVGTDEAGSQVPIYQPTVQPGRASSSRNPTPPPGGAKAVATPRPPQIPEAGPPPVSPKSALTRAKWLAIREKTTGEGSARGAANQPRLMQVITMSKQQGLLPSSSSVEKSSETTSTCSGTSSTTDSPHYRPPYEQREGSGIITVDAHAPHHPVVQAPPPPQAPPLAGNSNPWEWAGASNGGDPRDTYDLNSLNRGDSAARGSSFRPHRSASPRAVVEPDPALPPPNAQVEVCVEAQPREMAMRRKTALVLLDREIRNQTEQENYYKSLQGRRFKD
ncbi:Phospholipid phosphatase-related protein type 3 [Collichthys lucidus]|uniref:Phospholipid phosphatase-related protein type 3 n=1 Tax=Collichthys lucidus TaxID=240159 RepID=A0A4V6AP40_COLLU|nr:Phospholipid phosphatase-related protein type 3 [Collichthys lucidus]